MSENEAEDMGAIAWPGFVDILSSTVIMFVFFVMVVASALYFHIIIFKSKILSEISESTSASSKEKELALTNRSLQQKIKDLEAKMKILEETNTENEIQLFQQNTEFSESQEQKIVEDIEQQSMVIFFGQDSISVTEENQSQLAEMIVKYKAKYGAENLKVSIIAGKSDKSVNDITARRLAVARMLNVRNNFLETEIPQNQVIPSINGKDEIDGTHNWVKVIFERK